MDIDTYFLTNLPTSSHQQSKTLFLKSVNLIAAANHEPNDLSAIILAISYVGK